MDNQPPTSRPWFRLPNLGRQAPPPPPPASAAQPQPQPQPPAPQQPRLPMIRPAFRPTFTQTQPAPPPPPPVVSSSPTPAMTSPRTFGVSSSLTTRSSESIPEQSSPKPSTLPPPSSSINSKTTSSLSATKTAHMPTPTVSPIKTARSPLVNSTPSQLKSSQGELEPGTLAEDEQMKVLVQETFNSQVTFPARRSNTVKGFGDAYNSSKYGSFKEADGCKSSSDSEDGRDVKIITIAGENKGAVMQLGFSSRRNRNEINGYGSDNADWSKIKDHKRIATSSRPPMNVYVNSNVQGINGSILYNCSLTHHDPGVHFSLSRKPINDNRKGNDHGIDLKDHAKKKL